MSPERFVKEGSERTDVALNSNRLSSFCLAKAFIPIYPEPNFESLAVRKTVRLDLYK